MDTLSPHTLVQQLQWRYAVKAFDAAKKISAENWNALEQSLVLAPSSYGLQPWKFLVVTDQSIKDKLPAISWNQSQPKDCSHMVVLAARKTMDEGYVTKFIDRIAEVRSVPKESLAPYQGMILGTVKATDEKAQLVWNTRQVYIALGQLMTAAAVLGIDGCPMEGIVAKEYDKLLGLEGTEFTSIVGCALGYRSEGDKYASAKKVRFPVDQMVVHI
jgi:nitroreductase